MIIIKYGENIEILIKIINRLIVLVYVFVTFKLIN